MPLELGEQEMAALAALLEEMSEADRHPTPPCRARANHRAGPDDREATPADEAIAHLARSKRD
jgi:hypothetical protein